MLLGKAYRMRALRLELWSLQVPRTEKCGDGDRCGVLFWDGLVHHGISRNGQYSALGGFRWTVGVEFHGEYGVFVLVRPAV